MKTRVLWIFDANNLTTNDDRQFITKAQKDKLDNIATNKLDSKEILTSTMKNNTYPVYNVDLDRFIYKEAIDNNTLCFYTYDDVKRKDLMLDDKYRNRTFFVYDTVEKVTFIFQNSTQNFIEYRGQGVLKSFPVNKSSGDLFEGNYFVYKYSESSKAWFVDSDLPKNINNDNLKANSLSPINNIFEFKNSANTESLGNISSDTKTFTWQNNLDIKKDINVTGAINANGSINSGNTISAPLVRTPAVQMASTNIFHIHDKDGTSIANFNGTSKLLTTQGGINAKDNSTFEKDVTIMGKIINTDLNDRLTKSGSYKIMTTGERLTYIDNLANVNNKIAIYDTSLDKQMFWNGTLCYESPDGVTSPPIFPALATLVDGQYYYDSINEVVYRWNGILRYFGLIDNDYLDVVTGLTTTPVTYALANNVSLRVSRNTNYSLELMKTGGYAKLRYLLREVGSISNPTLSEAILSDGVSNINNMLSEGKTYELYISDVNNGQTYNIRFMFVANNMLIKDKWNNISVADVRNNYESITTSARLLTNSVPIPTKGIKTYYGETLKKDLSIGTQGIWYEYVGEIIENFPTSPTDGQIFTSTGTNKYIYRLSSKYWEYQRSQSFTVPNTDYLLCTVNGGTQITVTTDTDLTTPWKSTPIVNQGDITIPSVGRFRLAPNKSYKIRCNLGVAMSTSANDMSFTIRNYTTGTNIGINGKVGGDAVNTNLASGEAVAYIKTGSTSVDIGVRINFIRVINSTTTFYEASGGVAGTYIEIEQIESSVRQVNVDFVNQPTLLNLQKTNPSTKSDGDIWYDTTSSNLTFRQGSNDVVLNNDTFNDNPCLVTYYFGYSNFNASNNPVAGKFFFGNYMNTIGSTTQVQGLSANNPTWGGTGTSQWTLPKGVWTIRYWHINGDSPDSTIDWISTINVQKNGIQIHNNSMSKPNTVNGMDYTINGSLVVRSNGTDTIKFSTVNFALYSNNSPNGLTI